MGYLYYDLDDIDINISDLEFSALISKYYISNGRNPDILYESIKKYDVSKLSEGKKSIFWLWAERVFVNGLNKRDISMLHKADKYTQDDLVSGNLTREEGHWIYE